MAADPNAGHDALYMVRLELETPALFALGRRRRLPFRETDLGYLVHCHLVELFGERAPKPFRTVGDGDRCLGVLGYTPAPLEELSEHARSYADPAAYAACRWERAATKPMPESWPPGRPLSFEARLCPVVRTSSEGPHHRKGAEVDAFLAECWKQGDPAAPVDRESVYRSWLAEEIERRGGARLLDARLVRFRRARLLRRSQGQERKAALLERPDATLEGRLEVTDGKAFTDLLARGVGRHRAFGFGMLLLRPPRRP